MKKISAQEYKELREVAEIVMADSHGDKVLRMEDGIYLKLFRIRNHLSSARFYPYWRRFVCNAKALKRLMIATVDVVGTITIPSIGRTGVMYVPLAGRTIRDVADSGEFDRMLVRRLGLFLAELHTLGVHFRSIHLSNIVLCPDGELGLVDVSDMKIFPWPLWINTRLRNFSHLFRYTDDLAVLVSSGDRVFIEGYLGGLKPHAAKRIESQLLKLQDRWLNQ